jgi:hypothetical protein
MTAYDLAIEAEEAIGKIGITTSQLDLLNVIRAIVDDVDAFQDPVVAETIVRLAFDHFLANGGVDYDTSVGELLYSTVRDAVTDAMRERGMIPEEG